MDRGFGGGIQRILLLLAKKIRMCLFFGMVIPFILLIRLFKPFITIRFGSLSSISIGHLIGNSILFFEKPRKECVFVVNRKKDICNYAAYEIIKNKYTSKWKIHFTHNVICFYFFHMLFILSHEFRFLASFVANIEWIHHEAGIEKTYGSNFRCYDPLAYNNKGIFSVPDYFVARFKTWRLLEKINGRFVCFITRDHNFYGQDHTKFRNAEFKKLTTTINHLIENGYWVVRMGRDHLDDDFQFNSEKYIDYGSSERIDDVVDIMLIKECESFIGMNTGLILVQQFFDRKILLTNWFPIGMCPTYRNCRYILKRYLRDGRIVPYCEIPKELILCENADILEKHGFTVQENDEREITDFLLHHMNRELQDGIHTSNLDVVVTGGGGMLCKNWWERNKSLFVQT